MKQISLIPLYIFLMLNACYCWGQLPSINFGYSGNASGCSPHTVVFNISNFSSNIAGTTYVLNFGDGSPVLNYTQSNIPTTVTHIYNTISCGYTYQGNSNSFGATITATNSSGPASNAVFPIRISKKPSASFTLSSTPIIAGSTITFSNNSDPGVTYSGTSCNTNPPYYWTVTGPSSGTIVSGTLGNNNGFPNNTNAWASGGSPLTMQFNTSGSYQMKLSIGNSCGIDDTTLNFEVVNNGCLLSVQDVNYCNTNSAVLGVGMQLTLASVPITNTITSFSWTGPNGFTSTSQYPVLPAPVAPGNYTLTVEAPGCVTDASDNSINVSTTSTNCPTAAFTASPAAVCDGATTTFTNQTTGAGNSYFWLFGDETTSTSASPTHVYNVAEGTGAVTFTSTLVVTNSAGRMDIEQRVITVQQIPAEPAITSNQMQSYNGQEYFVQCTDDPTGNIFLSGIVSSAGSWVQSYSINWGEGSPVFNFTTFPVPCFHSYNKGLYTLQIILNGPNGCSVSNTYSVFVGGTPAISLGVPGSTEQCAPFTFNFPISNTANNSAGTTYTVTFNDGGPTQVFNHPPPTFVSHTFTESSCGEVTLNGLPNAFWVQITAQNPCDAAISTIEPIRISTPPIANYTGLPNTACTNNPIVLTNSADLGNNVNASGCNTNNGMVWSIIPATGWSLNSGALGSTNGPTNYINWTSGSNQLSILFTTAGNYTITQRIRNSCGEDTESQTVSITSNGFVNAGFDQSLCLGSAPIQLNGIPVGGVWSGAPSVNQVGIFSPNAAGTFTLTYTVGTGSCVVSDVIFVTVNPTPNVNAGADISLCITPIQYTLSGFSPIGGSWSGTGVTSSGIFTPNNIGIVTLTYSIVQGGCLGTDQISISVVNPIIPDAGVNQTLCLGSAPIQLSGTPDGGVWSGAPWVNQVGIFSPNTVGTFALVYTVGTGSCLVSDEVNIQVVALPNMEFSLEDTLFCASDAAITLTSGTPLGGVYFGSGVNGNQFDPTLTFLGESTIGYSYTDFNGCSNLVNENVVVEICTFIANSDKNKAFHVYPNPSPGVLNIQLLEGCSFAEMTVFSIDGQLITQKQLNASTQSFDFSYVSSGVYFIRLQSEKEIVSLPWYKFN